MRRITYWALSSITVLVLLFGYHTSTSGAATSSTSQTPITGTGSSSPSASSSGTTGTTSGAGSDPPDKAATVTGTVAETRWGPVQVQLTVTGKKITDVSVVQYPNGNGRDQEINSQALPVLIQETITAQSANIDMVSGATFTSDGYVQSLQSALDQANL